MFSPRPGRPLFSQLDRYVLRQLGFALVAVTGGLVALIWLTQSLRFIDLVVNRGLTLWVFLKLTGLLIPSFVAVILPITCFVVVQFVFQRLAGDRELTVMRSAGLSPFALARPALELITIAVACCFVLNLSVVPASLTSFREYQFEIRNRIAAFLLQDGVFTQVSDNLTVYIRSRDPDGTLHGILVDDARDPNSHATILAERGQVLPSQGAPRVLLLNGSRQQIDKQTGRLNVLTFAENTLDLASDSKTEQQRFRDATELPIHDLLHPDPRFVAPQDRPRFVVEAHKRLSGPLSAASFGMIALVSVLTGTFRRHGGVLRPLFAILAVVGLLALGLTISNVAARIPALIPLIWVQAALPGLVCAWVLFAPELRVHAAALREARA